MKDISCDFLFFPNHIMMMMIDDADDGGSTSDGDDEQGNLLTHCLVLLAM